MVRVPVVIVAGGAARRMGGVDKLLLALGRGTILSSILDRLGPEAAPVAINANGDPLTFAPLPVLPDPRLPEAVEERPGPLAGILAAMAWGEAQGAPFVVTVPGDTPFLPRDLVARLLAGSGPAVAASGGRVHPVAGLWPSEGGPALRAALARGTRRVEEAARALGARVVEIPGPEGGPEESPDPFLNVNTPEDLAAARAWAARASWPDRTG